MARHLNTKEAARHLGVSASFLHKARCSGTGPTYRRVAPRCIRYTVDDLDRWSAERSARCTDEYRSEAA